MTQQFTSLEIVHAPRFERDENGALKVTNPGAHQTLWSAIQELLAPAQIGSGENNKAVRTSPGPVVEFCIVAEPDERRNRIVLNIRNLDPSSDRVQTVLNALPSDYGWKKRPLGCALFETSQNLLPSKWQIARIERRLNFVDLPWRVVDTLDTSGIKADASSASQATWWGAGEDNTRSLVTRYLTLGELELERLCLPVSGVLTIMPESLRVLFQELRTQAPCVVSIAVAPVDADRLESYRRIGMLWGAYLQSFSDRFANAGFSDPARLSAQFDRFLLPDRFLCAITIRVAGASANSARSVSFHVAARLGGLRSFTIRDPVPASLESLGDPWNDIPSRERWTEDRWNLRRARFRREAAAEGVNVEEIEPLFEEFLIELPHIYTIDEAAGIAALPVSDEQGLPGLDTRLIAPFSDASMAGARPVFDANGEIASPPTDRVRIGIARDQSKLDATMTEGMSGIGRDWHTIAPLDLTKHALIVGSTGSGKTQTSLFLMRELDRLGTEFLVVEPVKTEYYRALEPVFGRRLKRFSFDGNAAGDEGPDFLAFDPMRLQPGVSVARHASYLKSCFESAFPLDPILALMLEAGIRSYYTSSNEHGCGLKLFSRGGRQVHRSAPVRITDAKGETVSRGDRVYPSLAGFQRFFLDYFLPVRVVRARSKAEGNPRMAQMLEEWRQIFERRFDALMSGMIGVAARKADRQFLADQSDYDCFGALLNGPCVVELDGIPDNDQKALMMAFLLTFMFERRQAEAVTAAEGGQDSGGGKLRHVMVVEEAHRVLANPSHGRRGDVAGADSRSNAVGLFVDMLAEIRAFGQGLIIVEQIPTKIVPEAVKNTNLKIMLRLTSADDRDFLGEAMNFTEEQKRFVTGLRAQPGHGIDMVVFEQQLDQPKLLQLPLGDPPSNAGRTGPVHDRFFRPR